MGYNARNTSRQFPSSEVHSLSSAKEKMSEIINQQPDDSSYDEILRELAFAQMVKKGLEDYSDAGLTISDTQTRKRSIRG